MVCSAPEHQERSTHNTISFNLPMNSLKSEESVLHSGLQELCSEGFFDWDYNLSNWKIILCVSEFCAGSQLILFEKT